MINTDLKQIIAKICKKQGDGSIFPVADSIEKQNRPLDFI